MIVQIQRLFNMTYFIEDVLFMKNSTDMVIGNVITGIEKESIAKELGIEPGSRLLYINGQPVEDIIDYKYLISDEHIVVDILKDGEEWEYEIDKDYDEDIGLKFENPIIDRAWHCSNKCIFCFIDQLPKGMRKTLYFKDDDSRLSFLQGNFITMTNMRKKDIERIIKYRISPLNVSVHTTNPSLRKKMLGNKNAGNIMSILKHLCDNGIHLNCQIVLCRGINDGEELKNTIRDLFSLYPAIKNVAVVPVGMTRYREGLYPLMPYDPESSKDVIDIIEGFQNDIYPKVKDMFVRAADEFYIMAGCDMHGPEYYDGYPQLEDGIGMITNFMENIKYSLKNLKPVKLNKTVSVVTGVLPYNYIKQTCDMIEQKISGLHINIYKIENNFFGGGITVTGLLTGKDIIGQLTGKNLGEKLIMPSNLLKHGEDVLLDDVTLSDIERKLGVSAAISKFDGSDLIDTILGKE